MGQLIFVSLTASSHATLVRGQPPAAHMDHARGVREGHV